MGTKLWRYHMILTFGKKPQTHVTISEEEARECFFFLDKWNMTHEKLILNGIKSIDFEMEDSKGQSKLFVKQVAEFGFKHLLPCSEVINREKEKAASFLWEKRCYHPRLKALVMGGRSEKTGEIERYLSLVDREVGRRQRSLTFPACDPPGQTSACMDENTVVLIYINRKEKISLVNLYFMIRNSTALGREDNIEPPASKRTRKT